MLYTTYRADKWINYIHDKLNNCTLYMYISVSKYKCYMQWDIEAVMPSLPDCCRCSINPAMIVIKFVHSSHHTACMGVWVGLCAYVCVSEDHLPPNTKPAHFSVHGIRHIVNAIDAWLLLTCWLIVACTLLPTLLFNKSIYNQFFQQKQLILWYLNNSLGGVTMVIIISLIPLLIYYHFLQPI